MILDTLENSLTYTPLHQRFTKAFQFLHERELRTLSEGRHEIEGEDIFAIVAREQGRKKSAAQLEAHNNFIDIQYIIDGIEEMGWRDRTTCRQPEEEFNTEDDIQFFADPPTAWITVHPGQFALFFPHDAHLPLISEGVIHKVVVKVRVAP